MTVLVRINIMAMDSESQNLISIFIKTIAIIQHALIYLPKLNFVKVRALQMMQYLVWYLL